MFIHDALFLYIDGLYIETAQNVGVAFESNATAHSTLDREHAGTSIGPRTAKIGFTYLVPNDRPRGNVPDLLGSQPPTQAPELLPVIGQYVHGKPLNVDVRSAGGMTFYGTGRVVSLNVDQDLGGHMKVSVLISCSILNFQDKTNR